MKCGFAARTKRAAFIKIVLCRDLKRACTTEAHFPKSEIFTNKFFKIFRGVHFFVS